VLGKCFNERGRNVNSAGSRTRGWSEIFNCACLVCYLVRTIKDERKCTVTSLCVNVTLSYKLPGMSIMWLPR